MTVSPTNVRCCSVHSIQHVTRTACANAFTRGYDGWLYACHGFQQSVFGRWCRRWCCRHAIRQHVPHQVGWIPNRALHPRPSESIRNGFRSERRSLYRRLSTPNRSHCCFVGATTKVFGKPHDGLGFVPPVMQHLHGSTAIGGTRVFIMRTRFPRFIAAALSAATS